MKFKNKIASKYDNTKLRVFSRHPSHAHFRKIDVAIPTLIRFGSITETPSDILYFEINTIAGIENSSNKLIMKDIFKANNISSPEYGESFVDIPEAMFPIVIKRKYHSRGRDMQLLNNQTELNNVLTEINPKEFYWEKYYNYAREYRIHVTVLGNEIHSVRKMLRPGEKDFCRNNENCVWYLKTNDEFNEPIVWDTIINDCVNALIAVGLQLGAFDVRVDKAGKRYTIIEVNSAPSMGEESPNTEVYNRYVDAINELISAKVSTI